MENLIGISAVTIIVLIGFTWGDLQNRQKLILQRQDEIIKLLKKDSSD